MAKMTKMADVKIKYANTGTKIIALQVAMIIVNIVNMWMMIHLN